MKTYLILAGALFYIPLFYFLCAKRPHWALALIFASAPFQNEVSGPLPVKFSLAEVNLLLSLPLMLLRARRMRFGSTFLPALLYLFVCLICTVPQWRGSSLVSIVQISVYLVGAVLVFANLARTPEDYLPGMKGLVVVGAFLSLAMFAHGGPDVFGLNKNGLGSSLAACFLVGFELLGHTPRGKQKWFFAMLLAIVGMGLLATLSRGSWLGTLVGLVAIFALRRQFGLLVKAALLVIPLVAVVWLLIPAEQKQYATAFGSENYNIKLRYESKDLALNAFNSSPVIGVGVGLRKEYDATNVLFLTMAETGVLGVAALGILLLSFVWMIWRAHLGLPRRSLEFSLLAVAAALSIGKLVHGMVDHYWSRGSLMAAWGAVGMAAFVAARQKQRRRYALQGQVMPQPFPSPAQLEPINPPPLLPQPDACQA